MTRKGRLERKPRSAQREAASAVCPYLIPGARIA